MSCVASNVNLLMWIANVWLYSSAQAETRAEFAERSVAKLEKTIDDLEGMIFFLTPECYSGYFEIVILSVMVFR